MFKKIFVVLLVGASLFVISKLSFALMCGGKMHEAQAQEPTATSQEKPVEVGNQICPVSGEKIDEKTKATYEYEGKIYNLCCAACLEEFKKDPEKYIKKVEEESQAESKKEATQASPETEMVPESMPTYHSGGHGGHQH